jgi:hypothetical protein
MGDYRGVVLPIGRSMIDRAISDDRDVFVKYSRLEISPGIHLFLYDTGKGGTRQIIAVGDILAVHQMMPDDVWNQFGPRLLPNKNEFEEYVAGRRDRGLSTIEVDAFTYLDSPIDPPGNVTVAGLSLDDERYQIIQNRLSSGDKAKLKN